MFEYTLQGFFEILVNAIKDRNTYSIMFWVYLLTIL